MSRYRHGFDFVPVAGSGFLYAPIRSSRGIDSHITQPSSMTTISRKLLLTAFAGLLAAGGTAKALEVANGDLLIGFYQVNEFGIVGQNTYVFNLGPIHLYRENSTNNISVSVVNTAITDANIGADLAAAFGDWMEDPTLRWGVVGGLNQTTAGVVNGDTQGTSYISRPVTNFKASGSTTTRPQIGGADRPTLRNNIEYFLTGTASTVATASNPRGAIIPSTSITGFNTYFNESTGQQFGINQDLRQSFGPGVVPGSVDSEGALDIWRMIHATSTAALNATPGVDLTSGFGTGNVVLAQGQFCGTLTIDTSGNLMIGGMAAATGGNYDSFAIENNLGLPGEDNDNDGVTNLIEYALDTNLTGTDAGLGAVQGTSFSFNKRPIAVENGDVTYAIEESDDLGLTDPWQAVSATETSSQISYTLPAGRGKVFARLKVTQLVP